MLKYLIERAKASPTLRVKNYRGLGELFEREIGEATKRALSGLGNSTAPATVKISLRITAGEKEIVVTAHSNYKLEEL